MVQMACEKVEMPLVSVVLLTYNRPDYLREALSSAVGQTYQNLEILVCNNASDLPTTEVINSFDDSRIVHIQRFENIGMTQNAVLGSKATRGKYLAHLHDDDIWEPTFIEKLVSGLEKHPEAVVAFCDHFIINSRGEIDLPASNVNTAFWKRDRLEPGLHQPFYKMALFDKSIPVVMGCVLRNNVIDWEDFPRLKFNYDFWMIYLACREGGAAYYVPERLSRYRVHGESCTSKESAILMPEAFAQCFERIIAENRIPISKRKLNRAVGNHYLSLAVALMRGGQAGKARKFVRQGFRHAPSLRSFAALLLGYSPKSLRRYCLAHPIHLEPKEHRYPDSTKYKQKCSSAVS